MRLFLLTALSLFAASAHGQDREGAARVHFQAGTNYFQAEEYEAALLEYGRALELSEHADLLYNIFLCHERLADRPAAIRALERYLAEGTDVPNRELLEERVRALRLELAAPPDDPPEPAPAPEPRRAAAPQVTSSEASHEATVVAGAGGGGIPTGAVAFFIVGGIFAVPGAVFGALAIADDCWLDIDCTDPDDLGLRVFTAVLSGFGLGIAAISWLVATVWALTWDGEPPSAGQVEVAPFFDGRRGGLTARVSF